MNPIEEIISLLSGGRMGNRYAPPVLGARGPGPTRVNPAGLRRGAPGANPDIMAIIKSLMGQAAPLPSRGMPQSIRPGGLDPAQMKRFAAQPPVLPSGPPATTPIRPGGLDPSKMAGVTGGIQDVIQSLMSRLAGPGGRLMGHGQPMAEQRAERAAAQPPIPPFNIDALLSDLGLGGEGGGPPTSGPAADFLRGAGGGEAGPEAEGGDPLSDFMRGLAADESGSEENPYEEPGGEVVVTPEDTPENAITRGGMPMSEYRRQAAERGRPVPPFNFNQMGEDISGVGSDIMGVIQSLVGGGAAGSGARSLRDTQDLDVEIVDVDPGSVKHDEEAGARQDIKVANAPGGSKELEAMGDRPVPDEAEEAVAAELKGKGDAEVPVETPEETAEGVAETAMSSGGPRQSYVIKRGDTLWDIAEKIYGDGRMYKQLARMNGITNPNMIIAGKELVLPEEGIPEPRRRPARAGV